MKEDAYMKFYDETQPFYPQTDVLSGTESCPTTNQKLNNIDAAQTTTNITDCMMIQKLQQSIN